MWKIFTDNTVRNDGRFIIKLPRKADNIGLGDSLVHAKKWFLTLEHKFNKNPYLKDNYAKFLNEYQVLGHMTLLNSNDRLVYESKVSYLPHHVVFETLTTKIRVVFDGYAKTTNGLSLNNKLLVGPTIQQDNYILNHFEVQKSYLCLNIWHWKTVQTSTSGYHRL